MAAPQTYEQLQARVRAWLDDDTVDAAELIALAEAEIRDRAAIGRAEVRATAPLEGDACPLPPDFGQLVSVTLEAAGRPRPLRTVDAAAFAAEAVDALLTGTPAIVALAADELRVAPRPDGPCTLEIVYRQELPALTAAAPANWLLQRWPNVYLLGALKFGAIFLVEDARAAGFDAAFAVALSDMAAADARRRTGPRPRLNFRALA